jgi:hypothetical protein
VYADAVNGNKVVLRKPLAKAFPAGTAVRLHQDRAPYNYGAAERGKLTDQWVKFSGKVNGIQRKGSSFKKWRPGTKYVQIMIMSTGNQGHKKLKKLQFRNVKLETAADSIITEGKPVNCNAVYNSKVWRSIKKQFTGGGTMNPLVSFDAYKPVEFEINAELTLKELNATAAAITAGNVIWGLDGGKDHRFFVESRNFPIKYFAPAAEYITPGKTFLLKLTGKNGLMTLFINKNKIGTCKYDVSRPLYFSLRPHRNEMRISKFTISGERADMVPLIKTCKKFLSINNPAALTLPRLSLAEGIYDAQLTGVEDSSNKINFKVKLNSTGKAVFPQTVLSKAWNNSSGKFNARPFRLSLDLPYGKKYICNLVLCNLSAKIDFPLGEIRKGKAANHFYLDGKPTGSIVGRFSYNGRVAFERAFCASAVKDFSRAGIHGNILNLAPYKYIHADKFDLAGFMAETEQAVSQILSEDPNAIIKVQYFLFMPEDWVNAHPDELIVLDNGARTLAHAFKKLLQPSYASKVWRKFMAQVIRDTVTAFRKSAFADRMGSFRLLYANCGEWNHWGYHEKAFVDYSKPMQRAFGNWLKKKYSITEKLRQAWGRNDVDFDSYNLVPGRKNRLLGESFLRLGGNKTRQTVDYYQFFQQYTAETIIYFAKAVKDASSRRLLTGTYYGYYFGHYGANPYHFQDSGNYGTGHLIRSKDIDFLGGPCPYYKRVKHADINGITGSVTLHGKVWVTEGDQRTQNSGKPHQHYGVPENLQEAVAIAKRNYMNNLQDGASYYFYDFIRNWYRDPKFMETLKKIHDIDFMLHSLKRENTAETALLYSEETIPYLSNQRNASFRAFRDSRADYADAWGVPVDRYLVSDIENIDFTQYKAVIFANSYYVDKDIIGKIKKYVAQNNRSLLFLYAPGLVDSSNQLNPEQSRQLTGIGIKTVKMTKGSAVKTIWGHESCKDYYSRLTEITDKKARIIARFADGALAGAQRNFGNYKSTVVCHPMPDAVFMRDFLQQSGVHVYSSGKSGLDDYYFAKPLIGVFSRNGGAKTITLPEPAEIAVNLFTGEILGYNLKTINFNMPARPHTDIFYVGNKSNYETCFKTP